jgi:hypothetical protein
MILCLADLFEILYDFDTFTLFAFTSSVFNPSFATLVFRKYLSIFACVEYCVMLNDFSVFVSIYPDFAIS